MQQRRDYISKCKMHTLIAFEKGGEVFSGKLIDRDDTKEVLTLLVRVPTKEKPEMHIREFVSYDQVLWVKTGTRWPSELYKKIRRLESNGESS